MRVVCIADTHLRRCDVPAGDVLIHAGDLTMQGSLVELISANRWLAGLPHRHKIVVPGNHDWLFQRAPDQARGILNEAVCLTDELLEVAGLRLWGSPWTPEFGIWAFTLPRGPALREKWAAIPEGLDILITHGPPAGIGDTNAFGLEVGCEDLRDAVAARKPRVHVFGHIHDGYGQVERDGTRFVNASVCTSSYHPHNPPIVLDL